MRADGRIAVVGIVEEQHPDRARLFMQWKQMDWPLMVDSLNLLGVKVVPITILIDEHGIVRSTRPKPSELDAFVAGPSEDFAPPAPGRPDVDALRRAAGVDDAAARLALADALFLWNGDAGRAEAITIYEDLAEAHPDDGRPAFRAGVARRARHDGPDRAADDFSAAVTHWRTALDRDPNQYIWRRRIQQYGPREDKPYSFYDWVAEARTAVDARGDTPIPLAVEPSGAEFARPARTFETATDGLDDPDPRGEVTRDPGEMVRIDTILVPDTREQGRAQRVHIVMRPTGDAHWNNEGEPPVLRIDAPDGVAIDPSRQRGRNGSGAVSDEWRSFEFELRPDATIDADEIVIPLAVFYNVCASDTGPCLYRRQDVRLTVPLRK